MRTKIVHCNCRNKEECPMGGRCNSENVVYQTNIFPNGNCKEEKVYTGISAENWKQRFFNRDNSSLNLETKQPNRGGLGV